MMFNELKISSLAFAFGINKNSHEQSLDVWRALKRPVKGLHKTLERNPAKTFFPLLPLPAQASSRLQSWAATGESASDV